MSATAVLKDTQLPLVIVAFTVRWLYGMTTRRIHAASGHGCEASNNLAYSSTQRIIDQRRSESVLLKGLLQLQCTLSARGLQRER